ncbi:MAG: protein-export chaperone SecB [Peptococcaceae bacterium]|nr:protein-export chaperone SecB [Peptococcaceae bacterium]
MNFRHLIGHRIQLHEVVAEKIFCRRYDIFDKNTSEDKVGVNINVSTRAKLINSHQAYAYLSIKIVSSDPKVIDLEVILRGLCHASDSNKKLLKKFIEAQALPLLLPWARELISSLTIKMGMPPLMLPLVSVLETLENNIATPRQ